MKKTIGIIMVVIAALNMVAWIGDAANNRTESPMYYIFVIMILGGGIWLISSAKPKNNKNEIMKNDKNKTEEM